MKHRVRLRLGLLVSVMLVLGGCETLAFYSQATRGQIELLRKREPIASLLGDAAQPVSLKQKLAYLQAARAFASRELKLPDNASYTQYADLKRSHVVWNVVATPRYSVTPQKHCFPVAGCVTYRGYFSQTDAIAYADKLRQQGLDVSLGGVSAYSTLGWFADPILSTMLNRPLPDLAGLLFHELAHQQFYKKGDTTFNESFATTVEREGLKAWLASRGESAVLQQTLTRRAHRDAVVRLILAHREKLAAAYAELRQQSLHDGTQEAELETALAAAKKAGFDALRAAYAKLQADGGGTKGFDRWIKRDLNNASLALFADYHTRVSEFTELLAAVDGDWQQFYAEVAALSDETPSAVAAND